MDYFWQQPHWPNFTWQSDKLLTPLAAVRRKQGDLLRLVQTLGFEDQLTAFAQHLADDVKNTAEIEGEHPDIESIRSSVARHLGLSTAGLKLPSHAIDNQVEILLDATHHAEEPLTKDRLFAWHRALFPNGSSGLYAIRVGDWRNDVKRVVSGGFGHETVHFEAPPPERIPEEIQHFLAWWNDRSHLLDGLLRAGIAHLYFVTIHPFDNGNGRITRALTDMALAQDDHFNQRYYSLSKTIMANRSAYYEVLETTQRGNGDCTPWLLWFIRTIDSALTEAKQCLQETLFKAITGESIVKSPCPNVNEKSSTGFSTRVKAVSLADSTPGSTKASPVSPVRPPGAKPRTYYRSACYGSFPAPAAAAPPMNSPGRTICRPAPSTEPPSKNSRKLHLREFLFRFSSDYFFSPSLAM